MTASLSCVYCDYPLALAPVVEEWVDPEGRDRCPDGGFHKPVLTVADIDTLHAEWSEDRLSDAGMHADWKAGR